ncbi:hypothetical protein Taro_042162 [Colocasia esculenta]|uniref:Uncharacterized protein n=1 Tax=Colocasia esculenta TaxID=4460 RepID=A0A843WXU9_COLES|nr:hypothetical protein [Colocasia esculenta]
MRRVGQSRLSVRDASACQVQNATGGSVAISPRNAAYRVVAFSGPAPESEREKGMFLDCSIVNDSFGKSLKRALGDAVLVASTTQTCANFPPAFICCVTWLVTMLAVALRWSVGDNSFEFPLLAGSLRDVEETLLAIVLGLIWICGTTEPRRVQSPKVTMQFACTAIVSSTLCHLQKCTRYNQLVDHVGIHGQRRLTEVLNKDSLVRQKEYPTKSSSKSRESVYIGTSARRSRGFLLQWSIDNGIPKTSR